MPDKRGLYDRLPRAVPAAGVAGARAAGIDERAAELQELERLEHRLEVERRHPMRVLAEPVRQVRRRRRARSGRSGHPAPSQPAGRSGPDVGDRERRCRATDSSGCAGSGRRAAGRGCDRDRGPVRGGRPQSSVPPPRSRRWSPGGRRRPLEHRVPRRVPVGGARQVPGVAVRVAPVPEHLASSTGSAPPAARSDKRGTGPRGTGRTECCGQQQAVVRGRHGEHRPVVVRRDRRQCAAQDAALAAADVEEPARVDHRAAGVSNAACWRTRRGEPSAGRGT